MKPIEQSYHQPSWPTSMGCWVWQVGVPFLGSNHVCVCVCVRVCKCVRMCVHLHVRVHVGALFEGTRFNLQIYFGSPLFCHRPKSCFSPLASLPLAEERPMAGSSVWKRAGSGLWALGGNRNRRPFRMLKGNQKQRRVGPAS